MSMKERLRQTDLLHGLDPGQIEHLAAIARTRALAAGQYLFLLGEPADRLYLVDRGSIELCFPMQLGEIRRDFVVETVGEGGTAGWSALARPYRFTLSGRAAVTSDVVSLTRRELVRVFAADPRTGYVIQTRISELVGVRMVRVQALWLRELQRTVGTGSMRRSV